MTTARVAITGFMHEVNAFAKPVALADGHCVVGPSGTLDDSHEPGAAVRRLRELRDVEIVALPVWEFGASGPLLDDDFATIVDDIARRLRDATPLDGVLVLGHGAGRTVHDLDADGTFLTAIRDAVGPDVPVVVVLDFHANVSTAMCDAVDVIVGYRTNPHVDIEECSVEAAEHLHRLLDGAGTVVARCRVPMVLPQIAQNTTVGEPLAEVRARADRETVGRIRNVSVFGGFSLADVPDCGLSVVVTADRGANDVASQVVATVAQHAWDLRGRFRMTVTPLDDSVALALEAARGVRSPVILADTADNPGGGAPGDATFLLAALIEAQVDDVVMGVQCDPAVVEAAWDAGVGARLTVTFNAASERPLARPLTAQATVLHLVDAPVVPTKGVYRGMPRQPGRACALDLGGIRIAVSSRKVQCADDDTLVHMGLEPSEAQVVVVKSRGHFRAGFDHLFGDDQIVEVGAPGVAPAVLDGVTLVNVDRPAFPFDVDLAWSPVVSLHGSTATATVTS